MIVRKFLFLVLGLTLTFCVSFAYQKIGHSYYHNFNNTPIENEHLAPVETAASTATKHSIQVALLLDTSGSMSGLIEQAKSQLWNILNELAKTEKDEAETTLEIALYEYGNPSKGGNRNQIHQLSGFTTDMDLISEKLFTLNTSGGEEYCGTMIQTSLEELDWKKEDGLKMIYIAGNEEFTQGPINFKTACAKAKEKGVIINTVYCGEYEEGINTFWKAGAQAGAGAYLNINHNQETVYVPTPYDDKINQLNAALNKTYIPYGKKGKAKKQNQARQDENAKFYDLSNSADRAAFKSSKKYKATEWDLVDAYKKDKRIITKAKIHADTLQNLSVDELEAKIEAISTRRAAIQAEIQSLDKQRRSYKATQQKNKKEQSLQKSMIETIQKQAKRKGYVRKD